MYTRALSFLWGPVEAQSASKASVHRPKSLAELAPSNSSASHTLYWVIIAPGRPSGKVLALKQLAKFVAKSTAIAEL